MFKIAGRQIGLGAPPFVIAEMSGNHNQSLDRALEIVDSAAASGAHALKLQTYTAETMTLDLREREFLISDKESPWSGYSLFELYNKAHTPWEWHEKIFQRARQHGMIPFSSPFDETAINFLESLDTPLYKIASFENTDLPLIKKVAATGKPMIISTGMATISELDETVRVARDAGCKDLILLKCTSTYPASPENSNLRTIPHLRELFGCEVGLSDHTLGCGAAIASIALGGTVIEKHFTLLRSDGGVDSTFSMEPNEFKMLVAEVDRAWRSLGKINYGAVSAESKSLIFRRSLYIVKDIDKGEKFTIENVRSIRPGLGLPTRCMDIILGMTANKPIKRGVPLDWSMIK